MTLYSRVKAQLAHIITVIFPTNSWYKAAYAASGIMAYVHKPQKKYAYTRAMNHADKLNALLSVMTRKGKPFPIPIQGQGEDLFFKQRPKGLILCSTHIPLSKVALRYLMEQGFKPTKVIAAHLGALESIAVWGSLEALPAIRTGPAVLQKAKTILQQGGSVVVLVDKYLGGTYSPNIFRLAEKLNSDIIFFDAALQKDGTIEARFRESNWNGSSCESRVHQQMNELYQHTAALLKHYNNSRYLNAPVDGM